MNASFRSLLLLGSCLFVAFSLVAPLQAQSARKKKNPTSRMYVADVEGQAQVNTGEKIEDLTKKSVHSAQGTVIQTKKGATNSMVFSNGSGIYLQEESMVEVRRFVQEPFAPNRTDMEVEPSISQLSLYLAQGSIGFCPSKPVAGSSSVYHTRHGSVALRGSQVFIQTDENETKISLLAGDVTVRGGEIDTGGQSLKVGQQAILRPGAMGSPASIIVQDIPKADLAGASQAVAMACMAKRTVYFDTTGQKKDSNDPSSAFDDTADEIVAIPMVPAELPVQHTVSTSRIQSNGQ